MCDFEREEDKKEQEGHELLEQVDESRAGSAEYQPDIDGESEI